jgi:dihydrofolate reductase
MKEHLMATVIADMSMSLDGFVADSDDRTDQVFGWFFGGDTPVPTANPHVTFQVSEASARELREGLANVGALISGRRTFDLADGWGGAHPMGVPVVVVTHEAPDGYEDAPFHFVSDGIKSAVAKAKELAGDKIVGVASPDVTRQCLDAGLLDGIRVSLVPVLLGSGVPWFANLSHAPIQLEGPTVTEGDGVTHLNYRVKRA